MNQLPIYVSSRGAPGGLSLVQQDSSMSSSTLDPATLDWQARVNANGGSVSAPTLSAVDAFVLGCKTDGTWSKLTRANLFCGNGLASCMVPLLSGGGSPVETNVNFVSGDYSESTGLQGNGVNKYLDTGLLGSAFAASNFHLSAYVNVATGSTAGAVLGVGGGAAANWQSISSSTNYTGLGSVATPFSSTQPGYLLSTQNPTVATYFNATQALSSTVFATPQPSNLLIFGRVTTASYGGRLGGYTFGTGLTWSEAGMLRTRIQTFQSALGRQV